MHTFIQPSYVYRRVPTHHCKESYARQAFHDEVLATPGGAEFLQARREQEQLWQTARDSVGPAARSMRQESEIYPAQLLLQYTTAEGFKLGHLMKFWTAETLEALQKRNLKVEKRTVEKDWKDALSTPGWRLEVKLQEDATLANGFLVHVHGPRRALMKPTHQQRSQDVKLPGDSVALQHRISVDSIVDGAGHDIWSKVDQSSVPEVYREKVGALIQGRRGKHSIWKADIHMLSLLSAPFQIDIWVVFTCSDDYVERTPPSASSAPWTLSISHRVLRDPSRVGEYLRYRRAITDGQIAQ